MLTLRGPAAPRRGPALNDLGIIPDGAILIKDGRIDEIGPARRVENLAAARGAAEISAHGRIVLPGFVDCHTHLIYPPRGDRAADPDAAARNWRGSTARILAAQCRPFLDAMARHGTTTVEAKTGCDSLEGAPTKALRVANLLRESPVDLVLTHLLRIPASATALQAEAIVADAAARVLRRGAAEFAEVWWDGHAPREDAYARYLAEAAFHRVGVKVHASGPACAGAVALAVGHRAVSIDHLEHLTPDVVPWLANSPSIVTLMPGASLDVWAPLAPARAFVDAGAAVALATDFNPHYTPVFNMQTTIALACMRMDLTPAEAISAATINAACALHRSHRVGSLEPGKAADLLVLNTDDYRDLVRCLGVNLVHLALKSGAVIYREGAVMRA